MGLEYNTARFLLESKAQGTAYGKVLTIGRQNLYLQSFQVKQLEQMLQLSQPVVSGLEEAIKHTYVEPFFQKVLGAAEVESMDFSAYENATHIHDLNFPVKDELHQKFDVVFDAGSLEHIMNFPNAIRSLMEMTKVGGKVFIQTPSNNYFGHGFYQFSPELFFRVFSAQNGFKVNRIVVFEHFYPCHFFATDWYEVMDPDEVKSRVQLVNNRPLLMLVEATRVERRAIFEKFPQQSDYITIWDGGSAPTIPNESKLKKKLKEIFLKVPLSLLGSLKLQYIINRKNPPCLNNRKFFRRLP